jgi:hypothetical protein
LWRVFLTDIPGKSLLSATLFGYECRMLNER